MKISIKNSKQLSFDELDVGDVFVFKYEVDWARKLKKLDLLKYNRKLPYIIAFVKMGENNYQSTLSPPIVDNRKNKKKLIPYSHGYTHKEAAVLLVE